MKDVALPPLVVDGVYGAADGGPVVIGIQKRGVPLFHARLSLAAGGACDPRGKEGLASFTAELLRRGTQTRSAHEVDELIEGMGAQLSVDCSLDEVALSLTVPAELAAQALDALLEVALAPSFPESEVTQMQRRTLAGLQSDLDEPSVVAGRATVRLGYGEEHPYGHPVSGLKRAVETFSRDDAAAFHAGRYQRGAALLAVAGPDAPDALVRFARARLAAAASWPVTSSIAPPTAGPAPQRAQTRVTVVHKPDSTQAQLRIVSPGMSRRDPRWAEAHLANTALGGGFTSLLVDAIRVDRGLSYSVSSRLSSGRHAGLSVFSSFTKNETLRELVDVAFEKMRGYRLTGPSEEALAKTKTYLAGLFPFGLEAHEPLTEQIADCLLDERGLGYLATYRSKLALATPEAVRAAAHDLSPAREGAQIVVVGDAEVAQRALADLGPVDVLELE